MRRLRRDALPEAAHAAFRRPHRRGQRHGLFLHLQRQPADHPVCEGQARPRPRMEQFPLRGQRRVRLGFRVSIDKQKEFACELLKKLAPKLGDDLVTGLINATQTDEAGIYDQRERVAALKKKLAATPAATRRCSWQSPTTSSVAVSGSSAVTAGL